jgi:hypothetical protein
LASYHHVNVIGWRWLGGLRTVKILDSGFLK